MPEQIIDVLLKCCRKTEPLIQASAIGLGAFMVYGYLSPYREDKKQIEAKPIITVNENQPELVNVGPEDIKPAPVKPFFDFVNNFKNASKTVFHGMVYASIAGVTYFLPRAVWYVFNRFVNQVFNRVNAVNDLQRLRGDITRDMNKLINVNNKVNSQEIQRLAKDIQKYYEKTEKVETNLSEEQINDLLQRFRNEQESYIDKIAKLIDNRPKPKDEPKTFFTNPSSRIRSGIGGSNIYTLNEFAQPPQESEDVPGITENFKEPVKVVQQQDPEQARIARQQFLKKLAQRVLTNFEKDNLSKEEKKNVEKTVESIKKGYSTLLNNLPTSTNLNARNKERIAIWNEKLRRLKEILDKLIEVNNVYNNYPNIRKRNFKILLSSLYYVYVRTYEYINREFGLLTPWEGSNVIRVKLEIIKNLFEQQKFTSKISVNYQRKTMFKNYDYYVLTNSEIDKLTEEERIVYYQMRGHRPTLNNIGQLVGEYIPGTLETDFALVREWIVQLEAEIEESKLEGEKKTTSKEEEEEIIKSFNNQTNEDN